MCHFEPEARGPNDDVAIAHTAPAPGTAPLVSIRNLHMTYRIATGFGRKRDLDVIKGIDLDVIRGETLGLVGESGCGKSTLARIVAGLTPATGGQVNFDGTEVSDLTGREWRDLRKRVQIVFQDPYGSLNPRRRVGSIIGAPLKIHGLAQGAALKDEVRRLMGLVGLNPEHYNRFPNEFSGGQRQRIGIARALALKPDLMIFDEPVSALDVSIQAQILNLIKELQAELNLTSLFISHDLTVVRHMCDRIAVMNMGRIIELEEADAIFANPREEYTRTLLAASHVPPRPVEPDHRQLIASEPQQGAM
nr:ATP-binding cassette domain-containing protein [Aliiroseovarius sediminis]